MSNERLEKLIEEYRFSTLKWFKFQKIIRHLKLTYYLFQRPLYSYLLTKITPLKKIKNLYSIDRILLNEGGMFKGYVYNICNKMLPIKDSSILVPGCGYGLHLITLSLYRPKRIVAFDLYEYPEEWGFVYDVIRKAGVEIKFLIGDTKNQALKDVGFFDWIITDSVLEHVKNLNPFLEDCYYLLKENGRFYACFGPIWYGPGGDHIDWGSEGLFNHLLLSKNDYNVKFKLFSLNSDKEGDSTEGVFMVKNRLFSYLQAKEYLDISEKCGFLKEYLWIKFSTNAWKYFKRYPERETLLQNQGVDLFDRYCSGMYIWARKIEKRQ